MGIFLKWKSGRIGHRCLTLFKIQWGLSFRREIRNLGLEVRNGKRPARPQRSEGRGRNGQKGTLSQNGYGARDLDPTAWSTTPKLFYVVCLLSLAIRLLEIFSSRILVRRVSFLGIGGHGH